MRCVALIAAFAAGAAADMKCPGSPAHLMHCGTKTTATAQTSCDKVKAEMDARVAGQYSKWHDPHNNGTYTNDGSGAYHRLTGDGKYTDKQVFTLTAVSDSTCKIEGCSESQVTSGSDFGTNYCDLKMLFCGSKDGCKPVTNDFTVTGETNVNRNFLQPTASLATCLKV